MLKASYRPYQLHFTTPVRTSRGSMRVKNGYFLQVSDGTCTGTGECSFIEGLSIDDQDTYVSALKKLCAAIEAGKPINPAAWSAYPSLWFGYQTALLDWQQGGKKLLFESAFTRGEAAIPINGLVWMGPKDFMQQQIAQKVAAGFTCIKLKVGALDFDEEVALLDFLRQQFPPDKIEIRLDANGAFTSHEVFRKLEVLSRYHIHSIEQPVSPGQPDLLREICQHPPIAIALDEELIGIGEQEEMARLLETIRPQYLILKPSLLGGFDCCQTWIELAQLQGTRWWATSALESNIGLNAIAQWVFTQHSEMVQGLGTGSLYTNNIASPLQVTHGQLRYRPGVAWDQV